MAGFKRMVVRVFAIVFAVLLSMVLFCGCSVNQWFSTETTSQSTEKTVNKSVISEVETTEPVDHDYDDYENYKDNDYRKDFTIFNTYDEIKKALDNVLKEKNFPYEANVLYTRILPKVYENYDSWKKVFPDMPEKNVYASELISIISNIKTIRFLEEDSEEAISLEEEYGVSSACSDCEEIIFLYTPSLDNTHQEYILLHETMHAGKQRKIYRDEDYFNNDYSLRTLLLEGGASFGTNFLRCYDYDDVQSGSGRFMNSDDGYELTYTIWNGEVGYPLYNIIYQHLCHLAGYQTVQNIENGFGVACLKKSLAQKYGVELSKELLGYLEEALDSYTEIPWSKIGEDEYQSNPSYDLFLNFEKTSMKCIDKKIELLQEKDDILSYLESYRYYKAFILPEINKTENDTSGPDIIDELLNIDKTDALLAKKVSQNGILQFSENSQLNIIAVKAVLLSNKIEYDGERNTSQYDTPYLIDTTRYYYEESDGIGKLYLYCKNRFSDYYICLRIIFDENEIKSVFAIEEHPSLNEFYPLAFFTVPKEMRVTTTEPKSTEKNRKKLFSYFD